MVTTNPECIIEPVISDEDLLINDARQGLKLKNWNTNLLKLSAHEHFYDMTLPIFSIPRN